MMNNLGKIKIKFIKSAIVFVVFSIFFNTLLIGTLKLNAQSLPNPISLNIPLVSVGDKRFETKLVSNNSWSYDGSLADSDAIRFGWSANKSIDLNCKTTPKPNCGYIKIYLNDDSSENNLITEHGTSPIQINKLNTKLVASFNRILLVYTEEVSKKDISKVYFSFNYKTIKDRPQISILEPSQGTLLMEEKNVNGGVKFKIELNNFRLTPNTEDLPDAGILKLFIDNVSSRPLATIKNSRDIGNSRQLVEFSSKDFDPQVTIPDNKNTKFIFVLAKPNGDNLDISATRQVVTNYGKTLQDIGIPEISFVEPKVDRVDLSLDGERKFILDIKNFELESSITDTENNPKKGYLQIFVDDLPIKTIWPTNTFTLNELQYSTSESGKKTLRVQLVNKDFTRLSPEASASLNFIYSSLDNTTEGSDNPTLRVDSTNWRLIFIGLVVLIILIGITILIIRG
jgi:hypothetical protein